MFSVCYFALDEYYMHISEHGGLLYISVSLLVFFLFFFFTLFFFCLSLCFGMLVDFQHACISKIYYGLI